MSLPEIGHDVFLSRLNVIAENGDGFAGVASLHRLQ